MDRLGSRPRLIAEIAVLAVCLTVGTARGFAQDVSSVRPRAASSRELLALYGIDASQLARFDDGQPLGPADEETLVRLLYYYPRFPVESLESWAWESPVAGEKLTAWEKLTADPAEQRGAVVRINGRVLRVERTALLPEVVRRVEFDGYYRVTMRDPSCRHEIVVAARAVPAAWPLDQTLDEPGSALGMFIKTGEQQADGAQLVFAAPRVAWHPQRTDAALGVTEDLVFWGQQGVDVGLLLEERSHNRKPFVAGDRDAFYELLSALRQGTDQALAARPCPPLSLGELLQKPEQHHGQLMSVEGEAWKVTKVRVDEPDVQQRYGVDHYYQIDMFVPLDNQVVRLSRPQAGEEVPTFTNSYPVTACVATVPEELLAHDALPLGVRFHATFFKLWSYRSEYVSSFQKNQLQLSPLLLGATPVVVRQEPVTPRLGLGLIVILVVSLLALWIGFGRFGGNRRVWRRELDGTR